MNRVLAVLINRMSLDCFRADLLCHQLPGRNKFWAIHAQNSFDFQKTQNLSFRIMKQKL